MTKVMLGILAGAFLGAFAMEMLEKRHAGAVPRAGQRARTAWQEFREAFAEGYHGPEEPAD